MGSVEVPAQVGRVGIQGVLDQFVDDGRAVEVAGVDVRDAQVDGLAQHGNGLVAVFRRPEDVGAGQLQLRATPKRRRN
jgi:hypothetical protein